MKNRDIKRELMFEILNIRRGERYRQGVIAAYRMCEVITQDEWEELNKQIIAHKYNVMLKGERVSRPIKIEKESC